MAGNVIIPDAILEQVDTQIVFTVRPAYLPELRELFQGEVRRKVHLTVGRPQRPKKTGEHSRNNLVHAWFADIAVQLGIDEEMVKSAMKRMSVPEGWPTCLNPIEGVEEPIGIRWASEHQMGILAMVTQQYAAINGLYLTVLDKDGLPTQAIGGEV